MEKVLNWYETIIHDEIIDCMAGCSTEFSSEAVQVIESYRSDVEAIGCTPEGFTPEQDKQFEELLGDIIRDLLDMDEPWLHHYEFSYLQKTDYFSEYDGSIINAPNMATGWGLFLDYSGEYGMPDEKDYECKEV